MSTPRLGVTHMSTAASAARARPGDWIPVLAGVPLFAGLSKRHLRRVAGLGRPVRFGRLTRIVRDGDRGDAFYVLLEGEARVLARRNIRLGPGDFFGELALLDGAPRSATVEAQTDVLALRIPRREFLRLLEDEPKVGIAIMRELAARLRAGRPAPPTS